MNKFLYWLLICGGVKSPSVITLLLHAIITQFSVSDPPSANVVPALHTVLEGDRASFQCQAGGTEASVVWSLATGQPLPHGADQSGNELIMEESSRLHAEQYKCTVTNVVGASDTSVATLVVSCK